MKKTFFYALAVYCLLMACNNKRTADNNPPKLDTLKLPQLKFDSNIAATYKTKFGIVIPRSYLILDSLAIELNNDSKVDTIVILSPLPLEDDKYAEYSNDSSKRLLVELLNQGGKSIVRNTYDNLVSKIGGVLSKYNGIGKTENGFEIKHESGSKYSWSYTAEFSNEFVDRIVLTRIVKVCRFDDREKILKYHFNNKSPAELNTNDSIKINCNCEKTWEFLERNENERD
jgi:hypothetical protein